jgi:hypothetical protein
MSTAGFVEGGPVVAPGAPGLMKKTRDVLFPLIVSWLAPRPWIVRFLPSAKSPLVSVIVHGQPLRPKLIESPAAASAMACRKLPAPLSLVLVTVMVAAAATPPCAT